ncbi:GH92 family glycosyl hydrolase [Aliiglaciecola sp. CAU 1673]|uniref:GH92 family glycosyl hydrolase n=1 Tax=Aliiglaciecola sp. CAU 1673 TaxID=3032595 RepID=UPI0023DA31DE|nr:GH92 family glycosyl hydrolase [Aliiglaciecola sp. CAU 1673]MDF2178614.1 GH92 family glycosyl hydrolase [Aliiglaciecola sp. CAU 1673]
MRALLLPLLLSGHVLASASQYVDPFIGTSNFGATHPGAQVPHGMVSVSPFNVAHGFPELNATEKDQGWNSRVYIKENKYLTGFSHLNLSGVGCPEAGLLPLMATSGELELDARRYGSTYSHEKASPGYYAALLEKYGILAEVTSTPRTGLSRFTFPAGQSHLLLNLGLGLSNETGGMLRMVSNQEIEGFRTLGTFCYHAEDVRPLYFVARFSQPAKTFGLWKKMPKYQKVEADWVKYNDAIKPYPGYTAPMAGEEIGAWLSFDNGAKEQVLVKIGISFVSIDNARANLDAEQPGFAFEQTRARAQQAWDKLLGQVKVEGSDADKTRFYTALYHSLIHPSELQDVSGDYPLMNQAGVGNHKTQPRYSVYSLWDTHRNLHPLLSLLYPKLQSQMVNSAVAMAKESGWLPKWELYGMETQVMVGDPGTILIADTYLRAIQDFDVEAAYQAMKKAATQIEENPLRPELADYLKLGYVPVDDEGPYDGSVATSLEYYLADYNLAQLAKALGKHEDFLLFSTRANNYQKLFDSQTGMLRPKGRDGKWLDPFDPMLGRNFEPAPGYIEGNAWNYRFYVPHAMPGLIQLLGGEQPFLAALDATFDSGNFDMTNEPDITYPFLYHFVEGQQWRSAKRVSEQIDQHFGTGPGGLPGNDDAGTMSAWLAFAMMGLYPLTPGDPSYALLPPRFDKVTIQLDSHYYSGKPLVIENRIKDKDARRNAIIRFNGKLLARPFISHQELVQGGRLVFE